MERKRRSFIIRLYFFTNNALEKLCVFLRTCFVGFWLGLFRRETLHLIDEKYYKNSKLYDNKEYNLGGLLNWEEKVINRYFQDCKSLLVTSVGGGREVLALRRRGYDADGFECNQYLVECANNLFKAKGLPPNIQWIPRDKCPESAKIYDGLIVGWGSYLLIQGRDQRVAFLKNLRKKIKVQSPILLSFFHGSRKTRFRIIKTIANSMRLILGRELLELGDSLVPIYVHYFTREEIISELSEGGFKPELYCTEEYGHAVGLAI